jgi:sulfofructose kinase
VTGSSPEVVCTGLATLDTIVDLEHVPAADERVVASAIVRAGGGPAATAAVVLARLGARVCFAGIVGDDADGEEVADGLRREGVDLSGLVRTPGLATPQSCVLVARTGGTRAICTTGDPARFPEPALRRLGETSARLCEAARWLHLDHVGYAAWRRAGRRLAPLVSLDGGNPIPGLSLRGVDCYAPSAGELARRYGAPLESAVADAHAEGARLVVATAGAGGCAVSSPGEPLRELPAVPVEVVSTLGAGDAFHGALVFGLLRGLSALDAAAFAAEVAAESCRALDGRSGVVRRSASRPVAPARSHTAGAR